MLSILFISLAGLIGKSVQDTLAYFYDDTTILKKLNPNWWDPTISYLNKYKNKDRTQGQKYFGSTTFLVFTTDAWHFFGMTRTLFVILAIIFYQPITAIIYLGVAKQYWHYFGIIFDGFILFFTFNTSFVIGQKLLKTKTWNFITAVQPK